MSGSVEKAVGGHGLNPSGDGLYLYKSGQCVKAEPTDTEQSRWRAARKRSVLETRISNLRWKRIAAGTWKSIHECPDIKSTVVTIYPPSADNCQAVNIVVNVFGDRGALPGPNQDRVVLEE